MTSSVTNINLWGRNLCLYASLIKPNTNQMHCPTGAKSSAEICEQWEPSDYQIATKLKICKLHYHLSVVKHSSNHKLTSLNADLSYHTSDDIDMCLNFVTFKNKYHLHYHFSLLLSFYHTGKFRRKLMHNNCKTVYLNGMKFGKYLINVWS